MDEVSEEVQYTLKRLIQGLASGRKYARLGYSVAFCQVLRSLECVSVECVLECIDEKAKSLLAGQPTKGETGNVLLGKTFAYLALVHSKKLFSGSKDQLRKVVKELLALGRKRSVLQLLCVNGLIEIIQEIRGKRFKKCVLPEIESQFTAGWGECTPDTLLLILKANQHHHKYVKSFLEEHWLDGQLVSEKNFTLIADVVMRSTSCHPIVHAVNDELVSAVIEQNLDIVKFWTSVIVPMLLAKGAQEPKRTLALHVFDQILPHLDTEDKLERVICPHVADILYHYSPQKKDEVGKRAVSVLSRLVNLVSKTDDSGIQLCVVMCLVTSPSSFNFDKHTGTSTLSSMMSKLKPESSQKFVTEAIKAYAGQSSWLKSNETNFVELQQFVVKELGIRITSSNELPWQLTIMQFLFLHSFFTVQEVVPDIPHCERTSWPVSATTRKFAVDNFYKAISVLITTFKTGEAHVDQFGRHLDVLYQLAEYGQTLLQQTDSVKLAVETFSDEAHEQWDKTMEALKTVHKKRKADTKVGENHAFELLFLHAGYQLFTEPDGAIDTLKDLHVCYKKSTQRRKSVTANDGPAWFDVITELLLSLMFKESVLSRNVAKLALQGLADHVTPDAFQQIVHVLQQTNLDGDDEDGLIGLEDDEDMDTEDNAADDKQNPADDNEPDSSDDIESSDDEESDESSEDSGIDEDGSTDMADLKEKVKSALGDAAADSDDDDEDDDDDDESGAPDLSDSEMFKLDDVLAAAFKGMKKGKRVEKKDAKEREKQLHDFKSRVLDLVEVVIKHHPTVLIIKSLVMPLLEMMEEGVRGKDSRMLANKATQVFKQLYGVKKIIPDAEANKDEIFDMLTKLMDYATKISTPTMVVEVAKACLVIIRLLLNIQDNIGPSPLKTRSKVTKSAEDKKEMQLKGHDYYQEKVVGVIHDALSSLLHKKERRLPEFFYTMIERYPLMFWPLSETLVAAMADSDIKIFMRTQACSMLPNLIHAKTETEIGADHWSDFINSLQKSVAAIFLRLDDCKPHFLRSLLMVLEKVAAVSVDACKQVLQDDGVTKLQSFQSTISKDTQGVFRRVMQKVNPEYYESQKKSKKNKKRKHQDKDTTENTDDPSKKPKLSSPSNEENKPIDSPSKAPASPIKSVPESPRLGLGAVNTNGVHESEGSPKKKHKKKKKRKSSEGGLDTSLHITEDTAKGEAMDQSEEKTNVVQSVVPQLKIKTENGDSSMQIKIENGDSSMQEVEKGSAKKKHKHKKRKNSMGDDLEKSQIMGDKTIGKSESPERYTTEQGTMKIDGADRKSPKENLGKRKSLITDGEIKKVDVIGTGAVGNGNKIQSPVSESKKPRLSITGEKSVKSPIGKSAKSPKLDNTPTRLSLNGQKKSTIKTGEKTKSPKLDNTPTRLSLNGQKKFTIETGVKTKSPKLDNTPTRLSLNGQTGEKTKSPKLDSTKARLSLDGQHKLVIKNVEKIKSPKLDSTTIKLSLNTPKVGSSLNVKGKSPKSNSKPVKLSLDSLKVGSSLNVKGKSPSIFNVKGKSPKSNSKPVKLSLDTPNVGSSMNVKGKSPKWNSKAVKLSLGSPIVSSSEIKKEMASPKLDGKKVKLSLGSPKFNNSENEKGIESPKLDVKKVKLSLGSPKVNNSENEKGIASPKSNSENVKLSQDAQRLIKVETEKVTQSPATKRNRRKSTVNLDKKYSPRYTRSMAK